MNTIFFGAAALLIAAVSGASEPFEQLGSLDACDSNAGCISLIQQSVSVVPSSELEIDYQVGLSHSAADIGPIGEPLLLSLGTVQLDPEGHALLHGDHHHKDLPLINKSNPFDPSGAPVLNSTQPGSPRNPLNSTKVPVEPKDSNIWNASHSWPNFTKRHPANAISHVYNGTVKWRSVPWVSSKVLLNLVFIAYPVIMICVLMSIVVCMSVCLRTRSDEECPEIDPMERQNPAISPVQLMPSSNKAYKAYVFMCSAIPSIMTFGTWVAVLAFTHRNPLEVYLVVLVASSAMMYGTTAHSVCFGPFSISNIKKMLGTKPEEVLDPKDHQATKKVMHWVVLPNYKEDMEVLAMAIASIGKSSIARQQIGVLLAMEQREEGCQEKVAALKLRFADQFLDIQASFHPPNLPRDPPGKASNVAWAFKYLVEHAEGEKQDKSNVILTVADADSEFSPIYFEALTADFLEVGPERKHLTMWQSPILHIKNYHQQPSIVMIGTMFTAMLEGAVLVDPNAIRFPYSTYSLPMVLAKQVGGWDPEWIAEDWHMGIKCYLMTLGEMQMRPVMAPTINYTPEDSTWSGTILARWAQAKRHALGFSDLAYIFMILPLIFAYLAKNATKELNLSAFWKLFLQCILYIIRLVNTHVIFGTLGFYVPVMPLLRFLYTWRLQGDASPQELFQQTQFPCYMFFLSSILMMITVSYLFQNVYQTMKHQLDPCQSKLFKAIFSNPILHWAYSFVICFALGPIYFTVMGVASWLSALKCLTNRYFEYEVALKVAPPKNA